MINARPCSADRTGPMRTTPKRVSVRLQTACRFYDHHPNKCMSHMCPACVDVAHKHIVMRAKCRCTHFHALCVSSMLRRAFRAHCVGQCLRAFSLPGMFAYVAEWKMRTAPDVREPRFCGAIAQWMKSINMYEAKHLHNIVYTTYP